MDIGTQNSPKMKEEGIGMSYKSWGSLLCAMAFALCLSTLALGQEITGTIVGTVKDSSGSVVPGATVTITDPSKGDIVVRTATTNDSGEFTAPNLAISSYTVTVEAPNFKKTVQTGVAVQVGERRSVEISLEAGRIEETVTVTADPVAVELNTPTVGTTLNENQLKELSINNRNFVQFVTLAPGVSSNLSDQVYVGTTNPDGQANLVSISVNGSRSSQNTFTVDGADITDRGSNLTIQAYPSVDSICQYRVLRSLYPAESGRSGGGQVNVVGCGGTSEFHGSLFAFVRNEQFNANTFFNNRNRPLGVEDGKAVRPPFRYNNYGFTIGGPVYFLEFGDKEPGKGFFGKVPRTFFFFSEEQRRDVRFPTLNSTVPDQALRDGVFPVDICLDGSISGTTRTCNQILPAGTSFTSLASINPVALAYLDIYRQLPLPNSPLANNPYGLSFPTRGKFNFQQEIFKLDTAISDEVTAYYRFQRDKIPTIEPNALFSSGSSLPGVSTTETDSPGRTHTFQMNYAASPNLLFEGRYAYAYGAILSRNVGLMSIDQTSVPVSLAYPNQRDRIPTVAAPGFNGFSSFGPYDNFSDKHDISGSVTYIFGGHTAKFGAVFSKYRKNENALSGSNEGAFSTYFNTDPAAASQGSVCAPTQQATAGGVCRTTFTVDGRIVNPSSLQTYANFLLGNNVSFSQASADYTADLRQRNFEFYAQDEFRAFKNLTLYYGVRYSFFGSPWDRSGLLSNFVPELYNRSNSPDVTGAGNRVVDSGNFCEGLIVNEQNYRTGPNGCVPMVSPFGKYVVDAPKTNFAPRVGFAWDIFGDGKTALRTGYGMYHEQTLVGIFLQNLIANPPFLETTSLSNVALDDQFGTNPVAGLATISVRGQDTKWKTPYMQHWSLDLQRQLTDNTVVTVGYYGSKGTNLIGIVDINLLPPGSAEDELCPVNGSSSIDPTVPCKDEGVPFTAARTNLDTIRPFKGYRAVNIIKPMFNSNYHSLQASATHRFSGASQVQLAYTWSKNLTDNQTDRSTAPQNPYDIRSDYGRAQLDRRHVFTANYVYELPFFEDQRGVAGKILGGWQLSGITTFQTGLPFTPTFASYDPAGLGFLGPSVSGPRPDQYADPMVPGPVMANPDPRCHSTISQGGLAADETRVFDSWFNVCAFQTLRPTEDVPVAAGSAGRGVIDGPNVFRTDLTLSKNFRFTESLRLQLRWEVFNVFNRTNYVGFAVSPLTPSSAGVISSTRDPRTMQFGAKFYF